jgi:RNA polymerase sigma factor (sigma-70 family)
MPTDRDIQSEKDRELRLVRLAQGAGPQAQDAQTRLLVAADHRMGFIARELRPFLKGQGQAAYGDLRQAGREGFLKALKKFDPSRGFRLWTFAKHEVRGAMLALTDLRESVDGLDQPKRWSLDYVSDNGDTDESRERAHAWIGADAGVSDWLTKCSPSFQHAFDTLAQSSVEKRMAALMIPLTKQERTVVQAMAWGISQEAIAKREGISQSAVSLIYTRARAKMQAGNGGAPLPKPGDYQIERQSSARIPVGRGRTMRTPRH